MYEQFFELTERPFAATPRVDRYFPGESIEAARLAVGRCIERAEGYAFVVGPAGTGKTLLCHALAEQFRRSLRPVILASGNVASRKALLQSILYELGLPFRKREEGELRLMLMDQLNPARKSGPAEMLLLVDEAHSLSPRLFDELRLLTNIVRQGRPQVRLVLCGLATLEERLAHPKLEAFQQRIAVRSSLGGLTAAETRDYVRAQFAAAGGEADAVWTEDALSAVHSVADGVPRLINQVCDHALVLAVVGGIRQINADVVSEAWADLQQLPLATRDGSTRDASAERGPAGDQTVIEFGSLDDDLPGMNDAAPTAAPATPVEPTDQVDRIVERLSGLEELDFDAPAVAAEETEDVVLADDAAGTKATVPGAWDDLRLAPDDAASEEAELSGPAVVPFWSPAVLQVEPVPIIVEDEGEARAEQPDFVFPPQTAMFPPADEVCPNRQPPSVPEKGGRSAASASMPTQGLDKPKPAPPRKFKQLFSRLQQG